MRLIETPFFFIGSKITTYSLRVIGFFGLSKRLELATKIKSTTTDILFEDSSLDDILEFFRWFNHAKPELLNSNRFDKNLSPRVCDDELLDEAQNRLENFYNLEFISCGLTNPHSRLNIDIVSLFKGARSIKFYNCHLDIFLSTMFFDNFKTLTALHTLSFIGCDLDSIVVAKLVDIIEKYLRQLSVLELKQSAQVTSLVERKIEDVFLSSDVAEIFPSMLACNVMFENSRDFSQAFSNSLRQNGFLSENQASVSWAIAHIYKFINDNELPFDEIFFKTFFSCRSAIFRQMTSASAGARILSPINVENIFNQAEEYLWEKFFSRYLERKDGVYLESQDLFEIAKEKLRKGNTSTFNEVVEDLMDLSSDHSQIQFYLKDLLQIAIDNSRYFPQEYLKNAINKCENQMDISAAYS